MRADFIAERIQRVTEDLRTIQAELSGLSTEAHLLEEKHLLVEKLLRPDMLADLKTAVDNLRRFLWDYLDLAAGESGKKGADYALQSYRLQRVTEMLRSLEHRTAHEGFEPLPEQYSFFEEIQHIAHDAMEKYGRQQRNQQRNDDPSGGPSLSPK